MIKVKVGSLTPSCAESHQVQAGHEIILMHQLPSLCGAWGGLIWPRTEGRPGFSYFEGWVCASNAQL